MPPRLMGTLGREYRPTISSHHGHELLLATVCVRPASSLLLPLLLHPSLANEGGTLAPRLGKFRLSDMDL